jgi:hypothetical protein
MKKKIYFVISFFSTLIGALAIGFYTYVLLFERPPELESHSLVVKLLGYMLPIILVMSGRHFWKKARTGEGLEAFEEKHVTYLDLYTKAIVYVFGVFIAFYRLSSVDTPGGIWILAIWFLSVLVLDLIITWKKMIR